MMLKLQKKTILGIDITPRFWLWDEINRLYEISEDQASEVSAHISDNKKLKDRIVELEVMAGTAIAERNAARSEIRGLKEKLSKADQPRNKCKFTNKNHKDKS